jgi:preprotein translocase subunit SecF
VFISLSTNGLDQGVDFVGGRTFQVRLRSQLKQLVKSIEKEAEVKIFGNDNQLKSQRSIRYKTMVLRLMRKLTNFVSSFKIILQCRFNL